MKRHCWCCLNTSRPSCWLDGRFTLAVAKW